MSAKPDQTMTDTQSFQDEKDIEAQKQPPGLTTKQPPQGLLTRASWLVGPKRHESSLRIPPPDPPQEQSRRILPREGFVVKFDKARIKRASRDHAEYMHQEYTLRNLPEFDSCEGIVGATAFERLFDNEVERLVTFTESESPPLFTSNNTLGGVDLEDFKNVSGLADQIWSNLAILQHQNASQVVKVPGITIKEAWRDLIKTRTTLRRRFAPDTLEITGRLPVTLQDAHSNFVAYCSLLDYVLGVMAWWLSRCATSSWLKEGIMVTLARWAVKLKLVAAKPVTTAQEALDDTQSSIISKKSQKEWEEDPYIVEIGKDKFQLGLILDDDRDVTSFYFLEKLALRDLLRDVLRVILRSLLRPSEPGSQFDHFEMCTFIYRTGLEGVTSMLSSSRHGEVMATSNLSHINFSYSAYELLSQNTIKVSESQSSSPSSKGAPKVLVNQTSGGSDQGGQAIPSMTITKIDELISLLVPLSLMNPEAAMSVDELIAISAFMSGTEGRAAVFEAPPRDFSMEFTITTEKWRRAMSRNNNPSIIDPDTRPLSESPLRQLLNNQEKDRDRAANTTEYSLAETTDGTKRMLADYDRVVRKMKQWDISPTHITVDCKWYVFAVTASALTIVLGALSIPFTLGERVAGVDPFQFTLFAWACAGFVLVLGNSRYVTSWPWHDFIKRRVVCRSLSDLSDVSGIPPQLILLYLLHNEWKTILVTSGPYNGMFKRRCDPREGQSDYEVGFSINIPVSLSTMFASGFVVLKVANRSGDALVCIDGRKGGWDAARQGKTANWMTCRDFNVDFLERARNSGLEPKDLEKKVLTLERMSFRWDKVLGVYIKNSNFG